MIGAQNPASLNRNLCFTLGFDSMRFEVRDDGDVLHASPQERAALDQFLSSSIETRQIDVSNAAGDRECFRALRARLGAQADCTAPVLSKPDVLGLLCLANAWAAAFRTDGPPIAWDVSEDVVRAIQTAINRMPTGEAIESDSGA